MGATGAEVDLIIVLPHGRSMIGSLGSTAMGVLFDEFENMQKILDEQVVRLDSTALRFLREGRQADAGCLALRSVRIEP